MQLPLPLDAAVPPVGARVRVSGLRGEWTVRQVDANGDVTVWGPRSRDGQGHESFRVFRPERLSVVAVRRSGHPKDPRTNRST